MSYNPYDYGNRHGPGRGAFGRGPMTWQSEAPRARHVGGKFFNPPSSGTRLDFSGGWHGDVEFSTPTIDRNIASVRQFAGQYLGTRLALGRTNQDLEAIKEDIEHPTPRPPGLPPPALTHAPDAFGGPVDPFGPSSRQYDTFGAMNRNYGKTIGNVYGPTREDMLRIPPTSGVPALNPAPVPIPLRSGPQPSRPKFGTFGDVDAGDARLAAPPPAGWHSQMPVDPSPGRRTTGGNDRRLKGLIARQLNDRME